MNVKKRAALEAAIYERVAPVVEAMLFPPTLRDVVEGMGNSQTGAEAHIQESGMLELSAVARDPEAARRALGLGVREAKLLAERLGLPLTQDMPISTVRYNETGSEWAAVTRYRLTESAAWPGRAPEGWNIVPGPVVERIDGDDRGRIVYHGNAIRPYMLYVYAGGSSTPAAIQTFESVQEATGAFGPMLDRVKAKADTSMLDRATEATKPFRDVGLRERFFYKGSTYIKQGNQVKGGKLVNAQQEKRGDWVHFGGNEKVSTLRDSDADDSQLAHPGPHSSHFSRRDLHRIARGFKTKGRP